MGVHLEFGYFCLKDTKASYNAEGERYIIGVLQTELGEDEPT